MVVLGARSLLLFTTFLLLSCAQGENLSYPSTRRSDHVDVYHGVEVADPYRWLEGDVRSSKEVAEWVRRQNEVTFSYLESIPERAAIQARVQELWNYEKYADFSKEAGRYYFRKNDGLQNQDVLYVQEALDSEPRVLIDPNRWSADGPLSFDNTFFSPNGKYVAYAVRESGSDWETWRVAEIETGRVLPDKTMWSKRSYISWTQDGRGFFYARYPAPQGTEEQFQSVWVNQKIYYHRIGTPQSEDILVHENRDHPGWRMGISGSSDGRYQLLGTSQDGPRSFSYLDSEDPNGTLVEIITASQRHYSFIDAIGPIFYFLTDLGAEKRRVIAIDTRKPQPENWREIVPEASETLRNVTLVGNLLIAQYLNNVCAQVKLFNLEGEFMREVKLPGRGSVRGFSGSPRDTETFYSFSNYVTPPTVYRYDLITGESRKLFADGLQFDPAEYVTEQVFYPSADGTRIPMFVSYKKGLERSGDNATLLTGYGGFGATILPEFRIEWLTWIDLGGVLAVPNLRGGGEYGRRWHGAGKGANKQNVFDDFIAAAVWLVENDYTSKEKLAIYGSSNGGLLIGAVLTQRPDLFGAALADAGILDMLRFHRFTAGAFWVGEYGSVEHPQAFETLLGYSPYHNIKRHSSYPATLITTADTDTRVVPSHSFKFAAELQHRQRGDAPVLLRVESSAAHDTGKPISMIIREVADRWAFLVKNLGVNLDAVRSYASESP